MRPSAGRCGCTSISEQLQQNPFDDDHRGGGGNFCWIGVQGTYRYQESKHAESQADIYASRYAQVLCRTHGPILEKEIQLRPTFLFLTTSSWPIPFNQAGNALCATPWSAQCSRLQEYFTVVRYRCPPVRSEHVSRALRALGVVRVPILETCHVVYGTLIVTTSRKERRRVSPAGPTEKHGILVEAGTPLIASSTTQSGGLCFRTVTDRHGQPLPKTVGYVYTGIYSKAFLFYVFRLPQLNLAAPTIG